MFLDNNNHFADPEAAMEAFSLVDESELAVMRGGLRLGSLVFDFGVNLRTLINGFEHVKTFRMTNTGDFVPISETITSNISTPATNNGSTSSASVTPISVENGYDGTPTINSADTNFNLPGLAGTKGFLFTDGDGKQTVALHQITRQKILSVLISDATDLNIQNSLDVDITVHNFSKLRGQISDARRVGILSRAVERNLR